MNSKQGQKQPPKPGAIKLIALDVDGTLLRSDNTIGSRTVEALREAHRRGVKIVLNSGRMTPSMETPANLLGLDVYLVSYNGAVASGLRSEHRTRLFERPMHLDVAQELVALARARRLHVNYYLDDVIYTQAEPHQLPFIELYKKRTGSPFRFVRRIDDYLDRAPFKVLFVVDPEVRTALEAELRPKYESRAMVTKTEPEYLEFLHPEVNKGLGLTGLCASLRIEMSEAMAVGDSDNDEPVIRMAGWGVGVANAGDAVRSVADAITEADCNNDGVAEAVERWVL